LNEKRTQRSDVKAAVLAAFKAGAPGVVLSRKYAEMKLTNLAGTGEALRELGSANSISRGATPETEQTGVQA
jgi:hypothetical protein